MNANCTDGSWLKKRQVICVCEFIGSTSHERGSHMHEAKSLKANEDFSGLKDEPEAGTSLNGSGSLLRWFYKQSLNILEDLWQLSNHNLKHAQILELEASAAIKNCDFAQAESLVLKAFDVSHMGILTYRLFNAWQEVVSAEVFAEFGSPGGARDDRRPAAKEPREIFSIIESINKLSEELGRSGILDSEVNSYNEKRNFMQFVKSVIAFQQGYPVISAGSSSNLPS